MEPCPHLLLPVALCVSLSSTRPILPPSSAPPKGARTGGAFPRFVRHQNAADVRHPTLLPYWLRPHY